MVTGELLKKLHIFPFYVSKCFKTIKEEKLFKKGNYSREQIIHRNSVCGAL